MKFNMILDIEDIIRIKLFVLDVPVDEILNAKDAFECDILYNGVDFKL